MSSARPFVVLVCLFILAGPSESFSINAHRMLMPGIDQAISNLLQTIETDPDFMRQGHTYGPQKRSVPRIPGLAFFENMDEPAIKGMLKRFGLGDNKKELAVWTQALNNVARRSMLRKFRVGFPL